MASCIILRSSTLTLRNMLPRGGATIGAGEGSHAPPPFQILVFLLYWPSTFQCIDPPPTVKFVAPPLMLPPPLWTNKVLSVAHTFCCIMHSCTTLYMHTHSHIYQIYRIRFISICIFTIYFRISFPNNPIVLFRNVTTSWLVTAGCD